MKPQFNLGYLLGLAIFLSQHVLGFSIVEESQAFKTDSRKIEKHRDVVVYNGAFNSFQHYIGARLVRDSSNELIYLCGSSEEKPTFSAEFTILNFNLKSESPAAHEISDLFNKILDADADVVYIREIDENDQAYDLYKALEGNYAYFVYVPPTESFNLSEDDFGSNGMLIASKYYMEKPQFNTFIDGGNDSNEGFVDFILKNADTTFGHVYAARSSRDGDRDDDRRSGSSWGVGVDIHYGGTDGPRYEAYVKGEAHDDRGNYVEGRADQNFNSGEETIGIHGGNKDEEDR